MNICDLGQCLWHGTDTELKQAHLPGTWYTVVSGVFCIPRNSEKFLKFGDIWNYTFEIIPYVNIYNISLILHSDLIKTTII